MRSPRPSLLLLLLALGARVFAATREQFCNLCQSHTMCLYSGVASRCYQGRLVRGVSPEEQQAIVDLTNQLRNRVALGQEWRGSPGRQPPAANMQRVSWDDEVASVAQRWADQCNYSHDSCRNVPDTYVGQNIYQRSQYPVSAMSDRGNWSEPIFAWYDEVALMAASQVSSYQNREDIGHYTQTVWATTNRIGCGYTFYQDGDWGKKYYVCNYAPGGNYVGQPLYQVGSPRSACPASSGDTGTPDPAYPGLCGRAPTSTTSTNINPAASSTPAAAATPAAATPAAAIPAAAIPAAATLAGIPTTGTGIPAAAIPAAATLAGIPTTGTGIPAAAIPAAATLAGIPTTGTGIPAAAIPAAATFAGIPTTGTGIPAAGFPAFTPTNVDNTVGGGFPLLTDTGTFSPDYPFF